MQKRNLILLLSACLTTGMCMAQQADPSQAQPPAAAATQAPAQRPAMDPNKQARHLGKQLGLSQDQVAQIKPILADRQEQVQALRADSSLTGKDRRVKAQAIMQDSKAKIEAVLTDPQKQQYEQMLTDRRSHRRGGRQSTAPAQPGV